MNHDGRKMVHGMPDSCTMRSASHLAWIIGDHVFGSDTVEPETYITCETPCFAAAAVRLRTLSRSVSPPPAMLMNSALHPSRAPPSASSRVASASAISNSSGNMRRARAASRVRMRTVQPARASAAGDFAAYGAGASGDKNPAFCHDDSAPLKSCVLDGTNVPLCKDPVHDYFMGYRPCLRRCRPFGEHDPRSGVV